MFLVQRTESGTFEPVDGNITVPASITAGLPDETLAQLALYRVDEPVIPAGKREVGPRTYVMQDGKVIAVPTLEDVPPPPAPAVLDYGDVWITDSAFEGGAKPSTDFATREDSWPAFNEAVQAIVQDRVGDGGRNLRVPPGVFYLSKSLEINGAGFNLIGSGGGMAGGNATTLRWPAGTHGIIVGRHNTVGIAPAASHGIGGDGSRIEDMLLWSHGQGTDTEHNGLTLLARAIIRNVYAASWPQDGFHVRAPIAPGVGNANVFRIEGGRSAYNGRNGLTVSGADVNAGYVNGLDVSQNGRWGIWDYAFLQTAYIGCHAEMNGWAANGITKVHARAFHQGMIYFVKLGRDADASLIEPGSDEQVWEPLFPGAGPQADIPQWEEGHAYASGGPYASENPNARTGFLICYSEQGQPPSQINDPAFVLGGMHAAGLSKTTNAYVDGGFSRGLRVHNGKAHIEIAHNAQNGDLLLLGHDDVQYANRLVVDHQGDILWTLGNSYPAFRVIQTGSGYTCGRPEAPTGAVAFSRLMVGDGSGEFRQIDAGWEPPLPGTGPRSQGDFRLNLGAGTGKAFGWSCIESGNPGTWQPAGMISAH